MPEITADLVRRLVADQFPAWADLPVTPVDRQGWDNRTFRLGTDLTVRLPSAEAYVAAVAKEDHCLPLLARHLPIPVPEPVATGKPGDAYPHPWSIRRWLEGDTLQEAPDIDRHRLATDLGGLLTTLRGVPAAEGPAAGRHSFFRGCHPSAYADEFQHSLRTLAGAIDVAACEAVWAEAMATVWTGPPVWFHGDIAPGNLLTANGRLSALIDFGTCGIGDPACEFPIAWTYFTGSERQVFREAAGLDDDTWKRARAWALWKALYVMDLNLPGRDRDSERVLAAILADPVV